MTEQKQPTPEVTEADFNERVDAFGKELQKLLGKYELGIKPNVALSQMEGTPAYCIVPQLQIISDRKKPEEKTENKEVEKPASELSEG